MKDLNKEMFVFRVAIPRYVYVFDQQILSIWTAQNLKIFIRKLFIQNISLF